MLVVDEEHELAVIIENKIGSREHSDQLERYYRTVEQQYPGYRVIELYLTPDGEPPSHKAYLPINYGLVSDVIEGLAGSPASSLSPDLRILMNHYTEMWSPGRPSPLLSPGCKRGMRRAEGPASLRERLRRPHTSRWSVG